MQVEPLAKSSRLWSHPQVSTQRFMPFAKTALIAKWRQRSLISNPRDRRRARTHTHTHTHTQVLITPHVSAVSYANDVAGLFTQNLKLYLDGPCSDAPKDAEAHARGPSAEAAADLRDRMLYVVDWEQGY